MKDGRPRRGAFGDPRDVHVRSMLVWRRSGARNGCAAVLNHHPSLDPVRASRASLCRIFFESAAMADDASAHEREQMHLHVPETPRFSHFNTVLGSPFVTVSALPRDSTWTEDLAMVGELEAVDGAMGSVPRAHTVTRPTSPTPSFSTALPKGTSPVPQPVYAATRDTSSDELPTLPTPCVWFSWVYSTLYVYRSKLHRRYERAVRSRALTANRKAPTKHKLGRAAQSAQLCTCAL